jgi:hypothetical protein
MLSVAILVVAVPSSHFPCNGRAATSVKLLELRLNYNGLPSPSEPRMKGRNSGNGGSPRDSSSSWNFSSVKAAPSFTLVIAAKLENHQLPKRIVAVHRILSTLERFFDCDLLRLEALAGEEALGPVDRHALRVQFDADYITAFT